MRDFTLIFGCMFSGKTTRLIEMFTYSSVEEDCKIAVKPLLDARYNAIKINSHTGLQMPAHRISKPEELYPLLHENVKEVYIDEIQFFGSSICDIVTDLGFQGIKVIAAGLALDYQNRDFGAMAKLKSMATDRVELHAKCHVCSGPAQHTYRTMDNSDLLLIGAADVYEARCKAHWEEGMASKGN